MPGYYRRAQPSPRRVPTRRRASEDDAPTSSELVLVDASRLQGLAWSEFHTARKRLEKAAHDLHRHEQVDTPSYERWVHRTFPTLLTKLRALHEEVAGKSLRVQRVQEIAMLTGRSAKKIWRDLKAQEADPTKVSPEDFDSEGDNPFSDFDPDEDSEDPKEARQRQIGDGDSSAKGSEEDEDDEAEGSARRKRRNSADDVRATPDGSDAKSVYRRLVQRLHPDRGGEWTDSRKRLWNEVQLAWAARDVDWLARLEIEWEATNDALSPDSPLSRLRAAIAQVIQARRDIERKLRGYRRSPQWRFTLTEQKREQLERQTEEGLRHDLEYLRAQLEYLNTTIAAWERPAGMARTAEFEGEPRTRFRPRRKSGG